jgi:hypothetical protein
MIRSVFVALSLTIGGAQIAYATQSRSHQPIAGRQTPQSTASVPTNRIYAGQSSMAIGAIGHAGTLTPFGFDWQRDRPEREQLQLAGRRLRLTDIYSGAPRRRRWLCVLRYLKSGKLSI